MILLILKEQKHSLSLLYQQTHKTPDNCKLQTSTLTIVTITPGEHYMNKRWTTRYLLLQLVLVVDSNGELLWLRIILRIQETDGKPTITLSGQQDKLVDVIPPSIYIEWPITAQSLSSNQSRHKTIQSIKLKTKLNNNGSAFIKNGLMLMPSLPLLLSNHC